MADDDTRELREPTNPSGFLFAIGLICFVLATCYGYLTPSALIFSVPGMLLSAVFMWAALG